MSKNVFRKMRGIDDKTLNAALTNHADVLNGMVRVATLLLRERRLLMVWRVVVTLGLVYALLFSGTPDSIAWWFR